MKNKKIKKHWENTILVFFLILGLMISPLGTTTVHAAGEVCEMNGVQYVSLDDALLSATIDSLNTITLLDNINYPKALTVDSKSFHFNLNGHTLEIVNTNGLGVMVRDGYKLTISGTGNLNVTGTNYGVMVEGAGSEATMTNVIETDSTSYGVRARYGGKVTVLEDVKAAGSGVIADESGIIEVGGNVESNSPLNYSATAFNGGHVHIQGDVVARVDDGVHGAVSGGCGICAADPGSVIEVDGDVSVLTPGRDGAYARNSGFISIGGRLQGTYRGANADTLGKIIVKNGNAVATEPGGHGIYAQQGGSVEVQNGDALGGYIGAIATGSSDGTDTGTPSSISVSGNAIGGNYGAEASSHYANIHIGGDAQGSDVGARGTLQGVITVDGDVRGGSGVFSEELGSSVSVGGNVIGTLTGGDGAYASDGGRISVAGYVKNDKAGSYGASTYGYDSKIDVVGDVIGDSGTGPSAGGGARAEVGGTVTVDGVITTGGTYARIGTYIINVMNYVDKTAEDIIPVTAKAGYFTYSDSDRNPAPINPASVYVKSTLSAATDAPQITGNSASLSGHTEVKVGQASAINASNITAGFVYSTAHNPVLGGAGVTHIPGNFSMGLFNATADISGLPANTTYYVRAYATNGAGTVYGNEVSFTTSSGGGPVVTPPTVVINTITNVTNSGAILFGSATAGSSSITEYGFVYGVSANPTLATGTKVSASGSVSNFNATLSGLTPATLYHVRAYATDSNGTTYGSDVGFTTTAGGGSGGGSGGSGSGSGGSGGGGGGSASSATTPKSAQMLDSGGNVIGSITPKLDNSTGTVTIEVNSTSLTGAFDKSKADEEGVKTVEVDIPKIDGAKAYEPVLPASFLTSGDATKAVEIKTHIATVTVPGNMLAAKAGAQNVSLSIAAGDKSKLAADIQAQIGSRPIIELNLKIDGQKVSWSNESAPVTVSIPYTPTADELKDPEHIAVWYIDGSGNAVSVPSGRYDPATGRVSFSTTHFSKYAVTSVYKTFDDLGSVTWAKKQIETLASKGIVRGLSEKEYAPSTNITRADFLYSLIRTLGVDAKVDGNFDDISSGAYYYKEIGIAKKLGITTGTENNKFNPDASITRQEMMVLTERALRMQKKLEQQGTASDLEKFADKSLVAAYAVDSIASVVKEGLIVGSGDKVNPLGNTTRAEAAVFLYRIYNKY